MPDYEDIVYRANRNGDPAADSDCLAYILAVLDSVPDPTEELLQIRGLLDARASGRAQRMEDLNVEVVY